MLDDVTVLDLQLFTNQVVMVTVMVIPGYRVQLLPIMCIKGRASTA
jgi:hypothetical protein